MTEQELLQIIADLKEKVETISKEQRDLKDQIKTVNQFISSITESQTFEQSMATIESMGRQVLGCERSTFWCYDGAENKYFSNDENRGGRDWQIAEKNMRIAAETKQVHTVDNIAYIPIISNDKVSGVLVAQGKDGGFDRENLNKFAPNGQIANTIELSLKKEFEHQGRITDELTRLKNRQGVKEYASNTLAPNINAKKDVCIVMCDIDHFKSINDTFGHDAGDTVLKNVANILQSGTRQGADSAFRWGGEEMICILNCSPAQGYDIAERLRVQIENTQHLVYDADKQPTNVNVTISMGIHHIQTEQELTPETAFQFFENELKSADVLAYEAKESGRNTVVGTPEIVEAYISYKATELIADNSLSEQQKKELSTQVQEAVANKDFSMIIEALENKIDEKPEMASTINLLIDKIENKFAEPVEASKDEKQDVKQNTEHKPTYYNSQTTYQEIDNKTYINTDSKTAFDIGKMAEEKNVPFSAKYDGEKSAVTVDGVKHKDFVDTIQNMEKWADKVEVKVAEHRKAQETAIKNQQTL